MPLPLITDNPIAELIYDIPDPYFRRKIYQKYFTKNMKPIYIQKNLLNGLDKFNDAIKIIKSLET